MKGMCNFDLELFKTSAPACAQYQNNIPSNKSQILLTSIQTVEVPLRPGLVFNFYLAL